MDKEFLDVLQEINDEIDWENATSLIDDDILSSFDIISVIVALDDHYDISIPAEEVVPANFNSASSMYELVQRLL